MEEQVINTLANCVLLTLLFSEAGSDYVGIVNEQLIFGIGDTSVCHTISIKSDDICELDSIETFFSTIEYSSGEMPIIITQNCTEVVIDDATEPECGKCQYFVNESAQ